MRFFLAIICAALSVFSGTVCGQEPPLPAKPETTSPTPTAMPGARPQLNIPEIPIPVEPAPLVPNSSLTAPFRAPASAAEAATKAAPALSQLDAAFQKSPLGQAAEEQRLHIEWRKLQNRTAHDPAVLEAKAAAAKARTDLEKRARLRAYYTIHFARMQALASSPELKSYLDGKKAAVLWSLAQPRVRPQTAPQSSPDS